MLMEMKLSKKKLQMKKEIKQKLKEKYIQMLMEMKLQLKKELMQKEIRLLQLKGKMNMDKMLSNNKLLIGMEKLPPKNKKFIMRMVSLLLKKLHLMLKEIK